MAVTPEENSKRIRRLPGPRRPLTAAVMALNDCARRRARLGRELHERRFNGQPFDYVARAWATEKKNERNLRKKVKALQKEVDKMRAKEGKPRPCTFEQWQDALASAQKALRSQK